MRASAALLHSTPLSKSATLKNAAEKEPPATIPRQPWHNSPVPYLFGGLAAILGIIAFALLILACSFWKLSNVERDAEGRSAPTAKCDGASGTKASPPVLVIMAGDTAPTFLATPTMTHASDDDELNDEDKQNKKSKEFREIESNPT